MFINGCFSSSFENEFGLEDWNALSTQQSYGCQQAE